MASQPQEEKNDNEVEQVLSQKMEELSSQEKPDAEIDSGILAGSHDTANNDDPKEDLNSNDAEKDVKVLKNGKRAPARDENEPESKRIRALEAELKKYRVLTSTYWVLDKPDGILSPDECVFEYFAGIPSTSTPSSPDESTIKWSLYVYTYKKCAYIGVTKEFDPFVRIKKHFGSFEVGINEGRKCEHFHQLREKMSEADILKRFSVLLYKSHSEKFIKEVEKGLIFLSWADPNCFHLNDEGHAPSDCPHMRRLALRLYLLIETEKHQEYAKVIPDRPYICEICQMDFTRLSSLQRHKESIHDENYNRPQCPFCGRRFVRTCSLNRHLNTFHPVELKASLE